MWRGEPLGFFSLGLALGGERRTSLKDLAGGEPAAMNLTDWEQAAGSEGRVVEERGSVLRPAVACMQVVRGRARGL
jgi:hypothetical protein